jgi:hypothetical protein
MAWELSKLDCRGAVIRGGGIGDTRDGNDNGRRMYRDGSRKAIGG